MLVTNEENPWPYAFMAALTRALDDAGIPNFQWGDLLNWAHFCENAPVLCGMVVSAGQLADATSVFTRAGLHPCACASSGTRGGHAPFDPAVAPRAHFTAPSLHPTCVVFLCENEDLLGLFPLTAAHPNPATLAWDTHAVPLPPHDAARAAHTHGVRCITAAGLVKVLMLCALLLPPAAQRLTRYPGRVLRELAIADAEHRHVGELGCPELDALWQGYWKQIDVPAETAERLKEEARRKWIGILAPPAEAA